MRVVFLMAAVSAIAQRRAVQYTLNTAIYSYSIIEQNKIPRIIVSSLFNKNHAQQNNYIYIYTMYI